MGLIGTFGGYYLYRTIRYALGRNTWRGIGIGTAVAAWTSVVVASIVAAIQLALSGTVPFRVALTAMASWHVLIAIGEAVITVLAISFVWRTRPDLICNAFVSRPHCVKVLYRLMELNAYGNNLSRSRNAFVIAGFRCCPADCDFPLSIRQFRPRRLRPSLAGFEVSG